MSVYNKFITSLTRGIILIPLLILPLVLVSSSNQLNPFMTDPKEQFVPILGERDIKGIRHPLSGIYPGKETSPIGSFSIEEIVNDQGTYFPGETIQVRNRFSGPLMGTWAITNQNISIYLHKQGHSDPLDSNHLITLRPHLMRSYIMSNFSKIRGIILGNPYLSFDKISGNLY